MTARYVAIDTETTGLDPKEDEIIEVAAIAFGPDGVLQGEFHSLVRPYRPLPFQIERLTGIEAAALESAPRFAAVASELAEFIGDSPLVGQNVEFDLAFLARGGVWPAARRRRLSTAAWSTAASRLLAGEAGPPFSGLPISSGGARKSAVRTTGGCSAEDSESTS